MVGVFLEILHHRLMALRELDALPDEDLLYRFQNDPRVHEERHMVHVLHVPRELVLPGKRVSAADLGKARESGSDFVASRVMRIIVIQILDQKRSGTDDAHVALQDIEELRKLVQRSGTEDAPEPVQTLAVRKELAVLVPLIAHGPELVQLENLAVPARSVLGEEDRRAQLNPDDDGQDQIEPAEKKEEQNRDYDVKESF